MAKQILTEDEVFDVHDLLTAASCQLDNLFAGTNETPTGINGNEQCFTKSDINTLHKAADVIDRLLKTFDGTRKQRIKRG